DRQRVFFAELPFNVVEDGPLRGVAPLLSGSAPRSVCAILRRYRAEYTWHVPLVLIPGFRIEVPVLVDFVVAGQNRILAQAPRVVQTYSAGGFGIGSPDRGITSGREAGLEHPAFAQLRGDVDAFLRVAVVNIQK